MELIDLRKHSLKYKTHGDIETSLAWNAVKKFLKKMKKVKFLNIFLTSKSPKKIIKEYHLNQKNAAIRVRETFA